MSTRSARFGTAAALVTLAATALIAPAARGQATPSVTLDPTSGAPGSGFTITMRNYRPCDPNDSTSPRGPDGNPQCIIIEFIQGTTTYPLARATNPPGASQVGPAPLTVPAKAVPGTGTVRAHSSLDDKSADFTVAGTPVTTTTTKATTTTSSSSTTTTSTTVAATTTTSSSTTTSTSVLPTTTAAPLKTKKTSSHSDVPRYIAVALVVLAAAATAGVDSRLRRLRG